MERFSVPFINNSSVPGNSLIAPKLSVLFEGAFLPLNDCVRNSRQVLSKNVEVLGGVELSKNLEPLTEYADQYLEKAIKLSEAIATHEYETLLLWMPSHGLSQGEGEGEWVEPRGTLHRDVASVVAFSEALDSALIGALTQKKGEALDRYCPDLPSDSLCASRVVTVTGLGCVLAGLVTAGGGFVENYLVDEDGESTKGPLALALMGAGVAVATVGLGTLMVQSIVQCCEAKPASARIFDGDKEQAEIVEINGSEARRLLEGLNAYILGNSTKYPRV